MKNFKGEEIPDFDKLLAKCNKHFENIKNFKKYRYSELYIKSNKGQFVLNTSFLNTEFPDRVENNLWGIYFFYDEKENPTYAGISRDVFRRLREHFLGKYESSATLAYLIKKEELIKNNNNQTNKNRKNSKINFDDAQNKMRTNWKISIVPIFDNYELYLTEIIFACELKTKWNTFRTH